MGYDILCRDKGGLIECLDSAESYNDAQRKKVAHQKRVKPRFVYLKKV